MAFKGNTFNSIPDGTNLDATNQLGGGDACTLSPTLSGTAKGSTTGGIRGGRGIIITGAVNDGMILSYTLTASGGSCSMRSYFYVSAATYNSATAGTSFMQIRNASANMCHMNLTTGRVITIQNTLGTGVKNFNSNTAVPDGWYRGELRTVKGTTTTDGTIRSEIFRISVSDSVALDTYAATNVNTGTTDPVLARIGKTSTASAFTMLFDEFYAETGRTTAIGAVADDTVDVSAGSDQINIEPFTTVTLTGTYTGAAPTSWTITRNGGTGGTVTLSGSGNTRTFPAPASLDQETYTFDIEGTLGAATDTDSVTITVLPHPEWRWNGTVLKPFRFKLLEV